MIYALGSVRTGIADYLSAIVQVYTLLIFLYIILQWLFAFGARPRYSQALDAVFGFLRSVCDPYLRLFRRVIPMAGPLDFSPIVAIIALQVVNSLVIRGLIHG